ncbi:phospho-sugar mutase [Treponema phagedenis]|uniref:Phospho-sugar mutase n=1 Tax=Treponema phagedenis TaxID=162 RepID=A0A0B7H150_TREPH|nr:phospho-sugar mutase [Treponema phagedenis]EFW39329.1 phosphoglucomutase/phosphomannomutase, alpha/beta/alpha domain II [Treponema phagedenis F0421]NVP23186.1 phospho-sugar mutase [Treponema phagedenis]QEJ94821.1 phospho-sugar mutase [Treponema phagedenis]QEJ98007.1 phospho-sugar mutase [Treponema phagedenis]QEK00726.1 phospho-sugar mutase [Treponema phagedenis]
MDTQTILERARAYLREEEDLSFVKEVEELIAKNDLKELEDRFYQNLAFGTGGLRGIIGGGTNRMNPTVIKKATQGLASYIIKTFPEKAKNGELKAAIACDCRRYSSVFAEVTALIFAANGFTVYLFSELRPTPELSFAIREFGCDTGVVVTASHNPPAYNGYKAYWNDGAQVIPPHDSGIIDEVNAVTSVKFISKEEALKSGKLKIIDSEIDEKYWAMVKTKLHRSELIKEMSKSVKIVYTPLHGTGALHVEKVLGDMGFNILTVPEQREPDGNFPTVSYPNPEDPAALKLAIALAEKEGADMLMATDPDSDRFACAVRGTDGKMQLINGNQMGELFTDYILLTLKEYGKMPKNPAIVRSIVTSHLCDSIAKHYGVESFECLTGFKWICSLVQKMQQTGSHSYIYGFEESYGYNFGAEVRDKDGITAAAICAEMCLYWRKQNMSLFDRLYQLFKQHGAFCSRTINKTFPGAEGVVIMNNMMNKLRKENLKELGQKKIIKIRDVKEGIEFDPENPSKTQPIDLPKSNVLQYFFENNTVVSVRPSGTEPKIKFYIIHALPVSGSVEATLAEGEKFIDLLEKELDELA